MELDGMVQHLILVEEAAQGNLLNVSPQQKEV
jgi:hypothetical protein